MRPAGAQRPVVAIAGASGFVGQALRSALVDAYEVVGLTRSPTRVSLEDSDGITWRFCDLFSKTEVEAALKGVDYAIYLVHSMLPSARLTQASFVDLDLLLADNFARAAEINGVKQIIYVGGIQPSDGPVSRHLRSRLEVESTLGGRATPTTAIRAGIIMGAGGSSMRMMIKLVSRLPVMLLPRWTKSKSAPIAIEDVVRAVRRCLGSVDAFDQSFEIGGPDHMSYVEMMERTARILDRDIRMVRVPVFSPSLSRRWVAWVSDSPDALVGPLIESLRHSILPADNWLQSWLQNEAIGFDDALRRSIDHEGRLVANPRRALRRGDDARLRWARTVRSVQRLPLPEGKRASWVAKEYMEWLPQFVWPFMTTDGTEEGRIRFRLRGTGLTLLELTRAPDSSTLDRELFMITGGVLARTGQEYRGRFEFREVLDGQAIIAAIHDFQPTLPWFVYNLSQALVHLLVMRMFGRHLLAIAERRRAGYVPGPTGDLEAPAAVGELPSGAVTADGPPSEADDEPVSPKSSAS